MILYPAIDLLDGEVVRLVQGDFAQKTIFAKDPKQLLSSFAAAGAEYAHLVDLTGAKNPDLRQSQLISSLLFQVPLKVQVGGGVRELADIQTLLNAGANRVVIGSLAVTKPEAVFRAIDEFGASRLTLALDVRLEDREPIVMTHGWTKSSFQTFRQVLSPFLERGLTRVLCTDISVDGKMTGPNVMLYQKILKSFPGLELQASGGVAKLNDIALLKSAGVHSAVVGRALLAGEFTLEEALAHAQ